MFIFTWIGRLIYGPKYDELMKRAYQRSNRK